MGIFLSKEGHMKFKQNELQRESTKLVITKGKQLPEGQFEAVLSTDDLDRHGERVSIQGMNIPTQTIKMYYNHETNGANLPIGKWLKVWKSNGVLKGQGQVDMDDDFAVKVYKKILNGFIDSISVGFVPKEFDGEHSTWTKSTLVEASVVAEPANVNAVITSKRLGFSQKDFNKSMIVKLKEAAKEEKVEKGAVADILSQQDKSEEMEDFWEVIYAFSDAYYSPDTPVTDFTTLLTECISILQTVAGGTYQFEDEDESDGADAEVKTHLSTLKSRVGALEAAAKAANESPATKSLIKMRVAAKQVDHANEELNKVLRIKLKGTN